jgi:hypothetical protein
MADIAARLDLTEKEARWLRGMVRWLDKGGQVTVLEEQPEKKTIEEKLDALLSPDSLSGDARESLADTTMEIHSEGTPLDEPWPSSKIDRLAVWLLDKLGARSSRQARSEAGGIDSPAPAPASESTHPEEEEYGK